MKNIAEIVDNYKNVFETQLTEFFDCYECDVPQILDAVKYGILDGGKRIRPILAYFGGKYCGKDEAFVSNIALGIEMIHSYSLVHDDLPCMDNDTLRHGKLTTHAKFGEDIGVLAGDGLLTLAFECLASDNSGAQNMLAAIKYIAKVSGISGMVGGQTLDIANNADSALTLIDLEKINKKKTACLLKAGLIGSLIKCGAGQKDIDIFEQYGDILGEIFQLVDDILDKTSDFKSIGKSAHKDENCGKLTYVERFGLEKTKERVQQLESFALELLRKLDGDTKELQEFTIYLTKRAK
ncbi:MAG: polyprenyl synthetase family protein [Clostridia bacterium]